MTMTAVSCPLPVREAVRDLLGDLFGRGVIVERAVVPLSVTPGITMVAAAFNFDNGRIAAVALCDLPFSISAGAAIAMLPENTVREMVEARALDGDTVECLHEVLNVFSKLLNSSSTPHVRLRAVHRLPGDLPRDVRAVARHPHGQQHYDITIDGYGTGRMSVFAW